MLFIQYEIGSVQPRVFTPAPYAVVRTISGSDGYRGHRVATISQRGSGKQTAPGFSNILAEEEDAILTRLQSA